jgi:hypothetical protein
MMLMEASWPSNKDVAVTTRTWCRNQRLKVHMWPRTVMLWAISSMDPSFSFGRSPPLPIIRARALTNSPVMRTSFSSTRLRQCGGRLWVSW